MNEIKNRIDEIETNLEKINQLSPNEIEAWSHFSFITGQSGALAPRNKEIIAVALSVLSQCQWCIPYHTKKALELGARKEELVEASWVAVLMGGSPSLMYAQFVVKALEELESIDEMGGMLYYPVESARLFQQLKSYVSNVCDEIESKNLSSYERRKLAMNFALSDSQVIERLVGSECDRRGWDDFPDG